MSGFVPSEPGQSGTGDPGAGGEPRGVYIHFPYCLQKCPYCDFVSYATERAEVPHERYADAVIAEMEQRRNELVGKRVASVFFGGGTPSLWKAEELGRVLHHLRQMACFEANVEITAEANPSSLDEAKARSLKGVGVNRLSIGVQGLRRERLEFLGRLHDETGGLHAVKEALASGMERVSADVIYGVAGGAAQTVEDAASEVSRVVDTGITHVSAYALTIEPSTVFGELARKNALPMLAEDQLADMFLAVRDALETRGFVHYEVSNYARAGHESRHNLGYWRGLDYVGLGCAAYGTVSTGDGNARRYRNKTDPEKYIRAALTGPSTEGHAEALTAETRLRERIMLGLRLAEGLDLSAAADALGVPAWTNERRRAADKLVRKGWLSISAGRLSVPPKAWLFADGTAAELF
ncbi:MAG: radical SAM family heme chaperone HemW [Polyangiaceae bacterium]|nr:radical SAM family heme chaperone HemW [Polyangiaceae bacterium]